MLLLNIEFLDLYYLINILCIIYSFGEISMHHLFMHQQIHWLVSFWIHSTQMCDPTDVFFLSKQGILPMFLEIWFLLKPINSLLPFENKNTYQCWIHISTCKKKNNLYLHLTPGLPWSPSSLFHIHQCQIPVNLGVSSFWLNKVLNQVIQHVQKNVKRNTLFFL